MTCPVKDVLRRKSLLSLGMAMSLFTLTFVGCGEPVDEKSRKEAEWREVTTPDKAMTISFPGKPKLRSVDKNSLFGKVTFEFFAITKHDRAYEAGSTKLPVMFPKAKKEKAFEVIMAETKKKFDTSVSQKQISKDGFDGIEFVVYSSKAEQYSIGRIYIDFSQARIYSANVIGLSKSITFTSDTIRFLDSMEFHTKK